LKLRTESNSFRHSQVAISKYLLSSCNSFVALFVVYAAGKLLYSSSTWLAIVAQYRLQEESVSRPLLTTALQTATFIYYA